MIGAKHIRYNKETGCINVDTQLAKTIIMIAIRNGLTRLKE